MKTIDSHEIHYNEDLQIQDLRFNDAKKLWEVRIRWKGFDYEDTTWEPLNIMAEDVWDMLNAFLDHNKKDDVMRAREFLRIQREIEV